MATIVGTDQEDLLLGFSGADALYGLAGNDVLQGGAAADHLEGGPGFDLASYSEAPADFGVGGVRARLDDPSANSIEAAGDTYVSIEGLIGSQFWDTLAGDDQNHVLYGLAGRDSLFGLGGDDILNSAWVPTFWTEGRASILPAIVKRPPAFVHRWRTARPMAARLSGSDLRPAPHRASIPTSTWRA